MSDEKKTTGSGGGSNPGSASQGRKTQGRTSVFKESQRLMPNRVAPKLVQKPPSPPQK